MVLVAISLTIGLVLMQYVHGQQESKYMNVDDVIAILGYCYQHADRPNPVQDLVDKGLVSAEFKGETCASVKQGSEDAQAAELNREREFANHWGYDNLTPSQYNECESAGHGQEAFGRAATICLFEEDRLDEDPTWVKPLTPEERLECENTGYEPRNEQPKSEEECESFLLRKNKGYAPSESQVQDCVENGTRK